MSIGQDDDGHSKDNKEASDLGKSSNECPRWWDCDNCYDWVYDQVISFTIGITILADLLNIIREGDNLIYDRLSEKEAV